MEEREKAGIQDNGDVEMTNDDHDVNSWDNKTINDSSKNRNLKSSPSSSPYFKPSYTRILRSGTTLGFAEPKKMRHPPQSRKESLKVWKRWKPEDSVLLRTKTCMEKKNRKQGKVPDFQRNLSPRVDKDGEKCHSETKVITDINVKHKNGDICRRDKNCKLDNGTIISYGDKSNGKGPMNVVDKNIKVKTENNAVSLLEKPSSFNNQTSSLKGKIDFTHACDIPEEVFIVSLSKDKNKELSVLSTSNGTLHVGSGGIHKTHLKDLTSNKKIRESPSDNKDTIKQPELIVKTSSGIDNSSWRMDTPNRAKKPNITDATISIDKMSSLEIETHNAQIEPSSPMNSNIVQLNAPALTNNDIKAAESDCQKKNATPVASNEHDAEDRNLDARLHSKCDKLAQITEVKLKPLSHFPLMEEILTKEGHLKETGKLSQANSLPLVTQSANAGNDLDSETQCSVKQSSGVPGVSMAKGEGPRSGKQYVKRSERIRSKHASIDSDSKNGHLNSNSNCPSSSVSNNKLEQGTDQLFEQRTNVKQKHRRHRSTSMLTPSSPRGSSVTKSSDYAIFPKHPVSKSGKGTSTGSKKKKKKRPVEDRGKSERKGKDFSRGKACMSQEVMDAIVKSIEETVSRVRCQTEEEEKYSSMRHEGTEEANASSAKDTSSSLMSPLETLNTLSRDTNASGANQDMSNVHAQTVSGHSDVGCYGKPTASQKLDISHRLSKSNKKTDGSSSSSSSSMGTAGVALTTIEGHGDTGERAKRGKRFRKKTRKAEEALGDQDIFWDDDMPVKKAKGRKKYHAGQQEAKDTTGYRRSRRGVEKEEQMSDPVLEEHAFILWASEHRSEIEQKLPSVSVPEMEALLSARWCDVAANVKAKFFARARDAFSDDDRRMIKAKHMGLGGLDSDLLCGFIMDRDPNFHDFVLLPINRQRDFLRKWLKFFQMILPRKEYIDFIITFKRACGKEDNAAFLGKSKRMRMRCLDPVHYKTLFDLIRLSKPRVLEAYKERKGKERKMVSNTYSNMLKCLINGDQWPHMIRGCRSKLLTELLNDLRQLHQRDYKTDLELTTLTNDSHSLSDRIHDKPSIVTDGVDVMETTGNDLRAVEVTVSLTQQDYSILETDLAIGLMADLSTLNEFPQLDQSLLDDVLQPPSQLQSSLISPTISEENSNSCLYTQGIINSASVMDEARCMMGQASSILPSSSIINPSYLPMSSYTETQGSSNSGLPNSMGYPKINIHYRSAMSSANRLLHRSYPMSHSTAVVSYRMCQNDMSGSVNTSMNNGKLRSNLYPGSQKGNNNSNLSCAKALHSYENLRENLLHGQGETITGRCIKMHSRHSQSQVRMSARPYQVPIGSLGPQSKHQKSLPLPFTSQHKLASEMCRQGMVMMDSPSISKLDSTYLHHNSSACRINNPSPLITSLSPYRTIKSCAQRSRGQGQQCQIVPHKSKIQYASSGYHPDGQSFWKTASAHAIPVSTTLRPCGSVSSRPQTGLSQMKVCLPTQALKIPIAKLRGARKTTFVKGRMKSIHLSSAALCHRPDGSSIGSQPSQGMSRQTGQSVLAKVLSFQSGPDNEINIGKSGLPVTTSAILPSLKSSLCPAYVTTPKRTSSLQIASTSSDRPDSQVHLVSVMNTHANPPAPSLPKMPVSSQTAVIINPLHLQRRPILPTLGFNTAIVKSSIDKSTDGHRQPLENPDHVPAASKEAHSVSSLGMCNLHGCDDANRSLFWEVQSVESKHISLSRGDGRSTMRADESGERMAGDTATLNMIDSNKIRECASMPEDLFGNNVTQVIHADTKDFSRSTSAQVNWSDGLLQGLPAIGEDEEHVLDIPRRTFISNENVSSENPCDKQSAKAYENTHEGNKENILDRHMSNMKLQEYSMKTVEPKARLVLSHKTNVHNSDGNKSEPLSRLMNNDGTGENNLIDGNRMAGATYQSLEENGIGFHDEIPSFHTDHVDQYSKLHHETVDAISTTKDSRHENLANADGDTFSLRELFESGKPGRDQSLQTSIDTPFTSTDKLDSPGKESKNVHQCGTEPLVSAQTSLPDPPGISLVTAPTSGPRMVTAVVQPTLTSPDTRLAAISVHSPVKRSGCVVQQLPVFSQVTEVSTPVTTSGTCRISTGIFHGHDKTGTTREGDPRVETSIGHLHPDGDVGRLVERNENNASTTDRVDDSATSESCDVPPSSYLTPASAFRRSFDKEKQSPFCWSKEGDGDSAYSSGEASLLHTTDQVTEHVPKTAIISTSSQPHATTWTTANVDNATHRCPSTLGVGSGSEAMLIRPADVQTQISSPLTSQAVSSADDRSQALPTVATVMKKATVSAKALTITVTRSHVVTYVDDTYKGSSESCHSPRRKRAQYVHEYLPT